MLSTTHGLVEGRAYIQVVELKFSKALVQCLLYHVRVVLAVPQLGGLQIVS